MSRGDTKQTTSGYATSRLKSLIAPVTIIGGSTLVAFVISDAALSVDRYRRAIATDIHEVTTWVAGLDPLMVAGIVAASALVAIVTIAKRLA